MAFGWWGRSGVIRGVIAVARRDCGIIIIIIYSCLLSIPSSRAMSDHVRGLEADNYLQSLILMSS